MRSTRLGKFLRVITIILVGLTAAMNILGGVGTTCAAFFTKKYPPMWSLIDYQWLYQSFVVLTILIGLAGAWITVSLIRGGRNSYRITVFILAVGFVINLIHVIASISLRGKATPADVVFGLNTITLIFALVLRLPRLSEQVNFEHTAEKSERAAASGFAAILSGALMLSVAWWAEPTHTFQGENWVYVLALPLFLVGGSLLMVGFARLLRLFLDSRDKEVQVVLEKVA